MSYFARELSDSVVPASEPLEWEQCSCLLCGGDNWTPLVEAPDRDRGADGKWFLVVQCQDCGLCFTNPRPTSESIGQFYRPDYLPHQPIEKDDTPRRQRWILLGKAAARQSLPLHGRGRLLDFGCGAGSYLLRMRRQGWKVTGVDASAQAVAALRERGLPAFVGSLPHPLLARQSFDVITMWQALEHVHAPMDVLQAARTLLAPGGKLIVSVPNIDSLPFRWFGQAWNGLDLPRHLVHFAPWTLRLMLHRAGFRPGAIRMVRRSSWLRYSANLACDRHPGAPRWFYWLRGKTASTLAGWYSFLTRQSDCIVVTATLR